MKIKPSVALNDNGFLFDPSTGESFTTNMVGKEIIFMMKQRFDSVQIRSAILEKYDVDEWTLEKNLIDFYSMLQHFNLAEGD